jgi:chemotaxis protein MotB
MERKRSLMTAGWLIVGLLAPTGCAEMAALRTRTADQQKQIQALQEENKQFQEAYYQIKATLDGESTKSTQQAELLQRDLEQARNLRTQKENDLNNQLRTRTLELEALRGEMEEQKKLHEATAGRLEREKQDLTAERDATLSKIAKSEEQLRQEKESNASLTRQVAGLKVELQAAQNNLNGINKELTAFKETLKQRDGELAEARQNHQQSQKQLGQVQSELAEARTQSDQLRQQTKQLTDRTAELQKSAETARSNAHDAQVLAKKNRQLEEELAKLKGASAQGQAQGQGQAPAKAASLAADPELVTAAARLREQLKQGGAQASATTTTLRLDSHGLRILLPSDALFKKNAIVLSDEAPALLDVVAKLLTGLPNREVRIEGHTDNQPVEDLPFADNWGLGFARADRVREYLTNQGGIAASRLTALTRAQFEPIGDNATPQGRARNRRVEIVVGRKTP